MKSDLDNIILRNTMVAQYAQLLEDMSHWDKDKRFMAASDLAQEILNNSSMAMLGQGGMQMQGGQGGGGIMLDHNMQKRIAQAFLKQLEDASIEVQGNAVKCLSKITFCETLLAEAATKLSALILEGEAKVRDIYATCLRQMLSELSQNYSNLVCQGVLPRMLAGIQTQDAGVREECVDVLAEVLKRFGDNRGWWQDQERMVQALLALLSKDNARMNRKAIACIGVLAGVLADRALDSLIRVLLHSINSQNRAAAGGANGHVAGNGHVGHADVEKQIYIQCIGAISRNVSGAKVAQHLNDIAPLFLQICTDAIARASQGNDSGAGVEVVESSLLAFEALLKKVANVGPQILGDLNKLLVILIKHDPNAFDTDGDASMGDDDGDDGFD